MKYTIEQLSFIVPVISIGFLAIITSINLYFKIRKRFPLTVNCWFCNENSRIPYLDNNKWTCKKCEQYNGFTEDGDYNCDIPAQRSSKLNKWKNNKNTSFSSLNGSIITSRNIPTNGLCQPCNRNQELKVQQLASFEPQIDVYFDEEVKEYRTKLEQAYRLCPRCERSLKRTLNKVKTNILGSKLKQIGTKGLRAFDLTIENESANKRPVHKKRHLFVQISLLTLILISLLQLYVISNRIEITKTKLDSIFKAPSTTLILTVFSYFAAVQILIGNLINNLLTLPYITYAVSTVRLLIKYLYTMINGDIWAMIDISITNMMELKDAEQSANIEFLTLMLNLAGCFMSTFVLFLTGLKIGPILSLLLWSCNMIIPSMTQDISTAQNAFIFDLAKLTLTWSLTVLSFVNTFTPLSEDIAPDAKDSSFHRLESESNSDASDSEVESELETSLRSNLSSVCGNRSMWEKTHVLNSTIASSSASIASHASLLSQQRQFASSTQSLCSLRMSKNKKDTSFGSVRGFNDSNHMDFSQNKFNPNQTSFVTSSQKQLNRNHCIPSRSQNYPDPDIISRCASRNSLYDVPDDFESGITQLSISGIGGKHVNYRKQTRIFGSSDRIRDSLQKSILAPSRLSANEHVNQSSWLAGGFWNNSTSPQKRSASQMNQSHIERNGVTKAFEVLPMMSRTSSHSSGFESMKNSTNNSRENSLCDDNELDRTFLFCEPASVARTSPAIVTPQPNRCIINQTLDSVNGMITLSTETDQTAFFRSIASPLSNKSELNAATPVEQFNQSLSQLRFPNCNDPSTTKHEQFGNPFSKNFPTRAYQRGSLLKLNMTFDH